MKRMRTSKGSAILDAGNENGNYQVAIGVP